MNWRFILLIFFTWCFDLAFWSLTAQPFPYLLRALLYTAIGMHSPLPIILVKGFLSLWQLFFITGTFGLDLLFLLPLASLYYFVCSFVAVPRPILVGAVFLAVVLQSGFDRWIAGVPFDQMGLLYAFLSAFLVVYLCSGSQGNRSPSERKVRTPNERGTLGN